MNRQEIFDTVAKHLLTQNRQSVTLICTCLYRGPEGLKCAIGCLIPDELYKPAIERHPVFSLICKPERLGYTQQQQADLAKLGFTKDNELFLTRLQKIHDNYKPEEWHACLKTLAKIYNLSLEVLND